jgi:hypothetical protein
MATNTQHRVYWISEPPTECDITGTKIIAEFVDGRMPGRTTWACWHPVAFKRHGGSFGTGCGQRYVKQPEGTEDAGRWLKVEG